MKRFLRENGTFFALVAIIIIITMLDPAFLTPRNLSNLTRQVTMIGIIAIGMTVVILIGGIDLSVGSVVAMAAVGTTLLINYGLPVWAASLIGLVFFGGFAGLWNGYWVARFRIPAFIITLGMMTMGRGLALVLSGGSSVAVVDPAFPKLGGGYITPLVSVIIIVIGFCLYLLSIYYDFLQKKHYGMIIHTEKITMSVLTGSLAFIFSLFVFGFYRGLPYPVMLFFALAFMFHFLLKNTRFGRRIYAMGGNEKAAQLSGINIFNNTIAVYIVSSVLASLSGIILASRLNGASPNLGNNFELDAISAVIIGGTSFTGGVGGISGTIIGVFVVGALNNGMSLLGINMFYQLVIKGLLITLAVWIDVMSKRS